MARATLGCLLIDNSYLRQAAQFLRPEDFDEPKDRTLFTAMLMLLEELGEPPDIVQLSEFLRSRGLLASVGGPTYTSHYTNDHGERFSTLRTLEYAHTVVELALQHQADLVGQSLATHGISWSEAKRRLAEIEARQSAASANASETAQQPDEDIPDALVQPFPLEVYPQMVQEFIEEAARAIHCPPDFIAAPLLPYLGAALGNTTCIEIKAGWREFPWIWLALVARPGEKKSPALAAVDQFFRERQHAFYVDWQEKYEAWKQSNDGTPEPVVQQVMTTDATLEALSDLLQANPRGFLFSRDELTGWALSMNQYKGGHGADRQNWLSFWNGATTTINRRNRKQAVVLNRPFMGVVGTLQPDVLSDLADERGRQDGFIHRILFSYPDTLPRKWTDDGISPATVENMRELFDLLWSIKPVKEEAGQIEPNVYHFTKEGKDTWITWLNAHYAEQDVLEFPDSLRGPWAKMEGYAARLALILHICRLFCRETQHDDIDEISIAGAVKLITYFKTHARRVYAHLYTPLEERQIAALLAWIRRHKTCSVTAREVLRSGVAGIKKSDDAKHLLVKLEEHGYGTTEDIDSKRGRKGLRFTLNKDPRHPTSDNNASPQAGSAA